MTDPAAAELAPPKKRMVLEMGEIDLLIARLSHVASLRAIVDTLAFRPELETSFNTDTAPARARELRLTMRVALGCYGLTAVLDPILLADLHFRGVILRALLLPGLFLMAVYVPGMPSSARERWLNLTVIIAAGSLALIAAASASAYAPYALGSVTLAIIFANTTLPLRFRNACLNTAFAILAVMLTTFRYVDAGLAFALDLQALIGCLFSLVATFRLERSERLTYLLALKERQRLDDVAAEREVLSTLSQTDGLTGLGNRVRLERWSEAMFGDPANNGLSVGLLMIDIDYFKGYNDHYGHGAGDHCLRTIAGVIAEFPERLQDLAVRYGGEEFIVILTNVSALQVIDAATRMRSAVAERRLDHPNRNDGPAVVTISVGVAHTIVRPGSRLRDVMDAADGALYAAKRSGRNRIEVVCAPELLAAS